MRGFAQANSPQGDRNIVLVHGAWADGSCGRCAEPFDLTGRRCRGDEAHIALQDGPVILVGHSYAGVVITEAGNDPKVVGLVYVAAFAPGEGESINSVSNRTHLLRWAASSGSTLKVF